MPSTTGMNDSFDTDFFVPIRATSKLMIVVVVVDASRSMDEDGKIAAVNVAMKELISELKDFAAGDDNDVDLKMAVMSFAGDIKWELKLTDIKQCDCFQEIKTRVGQTRYDIVFHALNKVISRDEFLSGTGKYAQPLIVFLTDGEPTDRFHQVELERLKKNKMFHDANRHVILMGDAVDDPVAKEKAEQALSSFVSPGNSILHAGDYNAIIQTLNLQTFLGTKDGGEVSNPDSLIDVDPHVDPNPDPAPAPVVPAPDPNPAPAPVFPDPDPGPGSDPVIGGNDGLGLGGDDGDDGYSFIFGVNT